MASHRLGPGLVLLLLCTALHACNGQFKYLVNPPSYLEGINPPPGSSSLQQARKQSLIHQEEAMSRSVTVNPRTQPPYTICVSDWTPMVKCNGASTQDDFKGYQIELFRMLAGQVGWHTTDYNFVCMTNSDVMTDLMSATGNCSLSATGIQVSLTNLKTNLQFSWPTYKSGLRVMISAHLQTGSTWAFSQVFHWSVWVALGATAVAVGLLVALIEWVTPSQYGETKKSWQSWAWYSLAKMMHIINHVGDPTADASRILVLGYGFLVLVMVSMYTATSASRITAEKLVHPIHSQKDLPGQKVVTWSSYVEVLKERHNIDATGLPWETEADKNAMVAGLRSGKYIAMVLDSPVLEYTVGTNDACDLFTVGEPFETFSLALAFPSDFSSSTVFSFSQSIVELQTYQGALDLLENVYIKTGGTTKCFGDSSGHASGKMITLYQVSGLWYILCITIGLCFVLTVIHNVRKDPKKMDKLKSFRRSFISRVSFAGSRPITGMPHINHDGPAATHDGAATDYTTKHTNPGTPTAVQPIAPSRLSVFLGIPSQDGHRDHDEHEEDDDPSSPKRMPSMKPRRPF